MSALQLMIDQLEARASELEKEVQVLDSELTELSVKGKALSERLDALRERKNHYSFAAANLVAAQEIENPAVPMEENPWGDAG